MIADLKDSVISKYILNYFTRKKNLETFMAMIATWLGLKQSAIY